MDWSPRGSSGSAGCAKATMIGRFDAGCSLRLLRLSRLGRHPSGTLGAGRWALARRRWRAVLRFPDSPGKPVARGALLSGDR